VFPDPIAPDLNGLERKSPGEMTVQPIKGEADRNRPGEDKIGLRGLGIAGTVIGGVRLDWSVFRDRRDLLG
jgi:hypothetical protein